MIPSFIILAIVCVLRLVAESLMDKYIFVYSAIPYLNWACIVCTIVFVLFVLANLLKSFFGNK